MSRVRIVRSEIGDVHRLGASMRAMDALEATSLGAHPARLLRDSYYSAILRRTVFVDGDLAAMWGLGGVMLSDEGTPWLVTAPPIERIPVSFVRIARGQVDDMLALRKRLSNVVMASYTGAVRLLEVLGFNLDDPQPMGPQGVPFRRFWITS